VCGQHRLIVFKKLPKVIAKIAQLQIGLFIDLGLKV
jgi:hypothetical protein